MTLVSYGTYHSGANFYFVCTFLNNGYFWTSCPYFVFEAIEYTCQFDTRFKRWTGHINSNEHQKNLTTFCIKKKFYFNQICFIFCKPGNTSGISSPCSKRVFQPKEERPTEWTPIHNKHLIEKQTKKLNSFIAKKAPTNVLTKRPSFLVLSFFKYLNELSTSDFVRTVRRNVGGTTKRFTILKR